MAGIAFQVATMATCIVIVIDFAFRMLRSRRGNVSAAPEALSNQKFLFYLGASGLGFLTIFIRCVYR